MKHVLVKVVALEQTDAYTLTVTFDDGTTQPINFEPVLYGHYLSPLRDPTLFAQVRIDPEIHTLVWPNGADFDPATLYNWHRGDGAELAQRAQRWQKVGVSVAAT